MLARALSGPLAGMLGHVGSAVVACNCTPGFTGRRCDVPVPEAEINGACGDESCVTQCPYEHGDPAHVCNCGRGPPVPTDRVRYEGTIRLANASAWLEGPGGRAPSASAASTPASVAAPPALVNTLEKLMQRPIYRRNGFRYQNIVAVDIAMQDLLVTIYFSVKCCFKVSSLFSAPTSETWRTADAPPTRLARPPTSYNNNNCNNNSNNFNNNNNNNNNK
ncbi:Uncharacterized protein GBIM_16810 [Gryllus bimaculatus]|nr:Uncharacterized protein GBIM_16810 [Gryllus bimaculatus]